MIYSVLSPSTEQLMYQLDVNCDVNFHHLYLREILLLSFHHLVAYRKNYYHLVLTIIASDDDSFQRHLVVIHLNRISWDSSDSNRRCCDLSGC